MTTFVDHDDQKLPDGTLGTIRSFLSGPFKGRRYHMVTPTKMGRRIIPDVKLGVVNGQPTLVATMASGSSRLRRVGRVEGSGIDRPAPRPAPAEALRHEDPVPVPPARP